MHDKSYWQMPQFALRLDYRGWVFLKVRTFNQTDKGIHSSIENDNRIESLNVQTNKETNSTSIEL